MRAELADAEARGEPLAILELAATLGELLTTAREEAAARSVLRAYLPPSDELPVMERWRAPDTPVLALVMLTQGGVQGG